VMGGGEGSRVGGAGAIWSYPLPYLGSSGHYLKAANRMALRLAPHGAQQLARWHLVPHGNTGKGGAGGRRPR
jgi:hypothetical protein